MLLRITDELCGGIKTHRLRIKQAAGEHRGVIMLDPRRDIDEPRERLRMAFGEAIAAEPLDLLEAALGEILLVPARDHAADHLLTEIVDRSDVAKGRHRAAQAVGFLRSKFGGGDRQIHRLFLKERHAEGVTQNFAQFIGIMRRVGRRIFDLFLSVPPSQIGMHHIALDRSGTDDRDLHDQIIELSRAQPRQHVDLRTTFDLKDPDAVALAQHVVNRRILGIDVELQRVIAQPMFAHQVVTFADAGQHAERQHINLHQPQSVDVVLVPFDESPALHCGVVDRNQFVEPPLGEHEAPDMLRQVAWCLEQFADEAVQPLDLAIVRIESGLDEPFDRHFVAPASPARIGEARGHIFTEA